MKIFKITNHVEHAPLLNFSRKFLCKNFVTIEQILAKKNCHVPLI